MDMLWNEERECLIQIPGWKSITEGQADGHIQQKHVFKMWKQLHKNEKK